MGARMAGKATLRIGTAATSNVEEEPWPPCIDLGALQETGRGK